MREEYGRLEWLSSSWTSCGNGGVERAQEGRFAATGGDLLHRLDATVADQKSTIKIVDGGTNVPREEIQRFADLRTRRGFSQREGQMLFARR